MQRTALCLGLVCVIAGVQRVNAQAILSDGTTNTVVTRSGNDFTITNGTTSGTNLFHSFREFSLPTRGSATFDLLSSSNISTIFSRVTGSIPSNIDGTISTTNSLNPVSLFLLNTSGILFGANARLNIGGSFVGTTANLIKFADGTEFSGTSSIGTPLLTMSVPIGLQMGSTSRNIIVTGTGHTLASRDPLGLSPLTVNSRPGLQVRLGNTIALLGNGVTFTNGVVGAAQGQIEVGSVDEGIVNLGQRGSAWTLGYTGITNFNLITLTGRSLLDVSGVNAGAIQVHGRSIQLSDGSQLVSQNFGAIAAGPIQVTATEVLTLTGATLDGQIRSGITSETLGPSTSSKILVSAPQINLAQGAAIASKTFSQAKGGDITINAAQGLNLQGFGVRNPIQSSSIGSVTLGPANGGAVQITAKDIQLFQGGSLGANTFGRGMSGGITVNADTIVMGGGLTPTGTPSAIAVNTLGAGHAGLLTVNTRTLAITEAATIASSGYTFGNAGNIIVNARESILLDGFVNLPNDQLASSINSSITDPSPALQQLLNIKGTPIASAGSVEINTPDLRVRNYAKITARNVGTGAVGDVRVNANQIQLQNGNITNQSVGSGQGGTIEVTGRTLFLDRNSQINASTVASNGGNVMLNIAELLRLRDRSLINANAGGTGRGGNIQLTAQFVVGSGDSDIIANAVEGQGGRITMTTQRLFGLQYRDRLTPENDITASSKLGINGTVHINNVGIDPYSGLIQLPVALVDPTQKIAKGCKADQSSRFVVTGRGGVPNNPIQGTSREHTWQDLRPLSDSYQANRVKLTPVLVEATRWERDHNGKVQLVAGSPVVQAMEVTCAH